MSAAVKHSTRQPPQSPLPQVGEGSGHLTPVIPAQAGIQFPQSSAAAPIDTPPHRPHAAAGKTP